LVGHFGVTPFFGGNFPNSNKSNLHHQRLQEKAVSLPEKARGDRMVMFSAGSLVVANTLRISAMSG